MEEAALERRFDAPIKGSRRDLELTRTGLGRWLAGPLGAGGAARVSPISTPAGTGVANETLIFDASWSVGGEERRLPLVARVATDTPLYLDADIETHYRMYEALADAPGVPVPAVYGYEADPAVLGAPFFVMERIEGDIPGDRPHWSESGFVHDADPGQRRRLWESAVGALAALHQVPVERFGFLAAADGADGLAANLAYWRRYLDWATGDRPLDVLEQGWAYLDAHRPADLPAGLSWGDSRIANVIFRDFRCVGVLDWDTVSLAGPETDLAWWIVMDGPGAERLPGIGTPDELVDLWESLTGRRCGDLDYFLVFTAFRLGAILCKLFGQMAASGLLAPSEAARQAAESDQVRLLAVLLGVPPPGDGPVVVPRLRRR